jgi:hypothetical protein
MRHGLQMGLDFPSTVWNPLTGLPVSKNMLTELDSLTETHLKRVQEAFEKKERSGCIIFLHYHGLDD